MVDATSKLPIRDEGKQPTRSEPSIWQPLGALGSDIDRMFDEFYRSDWLRPFRAKASGPAALFARQFAWAPPAVDIAQNDSAYEITAELPGMDAQNVEVVLRNGNIVIKGEKQEDKEEKSKDYFVHERQYGGFERAFAVPEDVEAEKIEAHFSKGLLTITLPKSATARKPEQKISVQAA